MKTLFILISLFFAVSLSARQRDSRVREYLPPARIVWQQESQLIQGANHLLLSGNGQSNLVNHNICKLSTITSDDKPALGGVYKMSAEIIDGVVYPKIKLSENAVKITNPGIKTVYRLYDKDHMAIADLIALRDEKFDTTKPLTIYHPEQTYKRMTLTDYTMRELLVPIFIDGKQVYNCPTIQQIQAYAKQELDTLWEESKRLMNPQVYKVDYSDGLYDLRQKLIREHRKLPANA